LNLCDTTATEHLATSSVTLKGAQHVHKHSMLFAYTDQTEQAYPIDACFHLNETYMPMEKLNYISFFFFSSNRLSLVFISIAITVTSDVFTYRERMSYLVVVA
jgi:hypothetical protein